MYIFYTFHRVFHMLHCVFRIYHSIHLTSHIEITRAIVRFRIFRFHSHFRAIDICRISVIHTFILNKHPILLSYLCFHFAFNPRIISYLYQLLCTQIFHNCNLSEIIYAIGCHSYDISVIHKAWPILHSLIKNVTSRHKTRTRTTTPPTPTPHPPTHPPPPPPPKKKKKHCQISTHFRN